MRLDPDQERVANHGNGNALVLAGAGSGKTACVTERAARRLISGVHPSRLLLLTFTNKACKEMSERLEKRLREEGFLGGMPLVNTFHSFGHRLLRKNAAACYRRPNPSLLDADDSEKMLLTLMQDHAMSRGGLDLALAAYDKIRNDGLDPTVESEKAALLRLLTLREHILPEEAPKLLEVAAAYELRKREQNLIDFDDLICLPIRALRENPDLRTRVNTQLLDITVDESQDNNLAQYKLLRLLAGPTVVMVGDDDQSIHRWRGAHPDGLGQFQKEFEATIYRLERNYRSVPVIVNSATSLIRCNTERMEKNPYPVRQEDRGPIPHHNHFTSDAMAEQIASSIRKTMAAGIPADRIAILYRTNSMARVLEPSLLKYGIPYRIKAGMEMMQFAEIKMMMAAARLAVNPHDLQALHRLSDLVPGLGEKSIARMAESPNEKGILENWPLAPKKHQETLQKLQASLADLYRQGPDKLIAWAVGPGGFKAWMTKEAERAAKTRHKDPESANFKEAVNEILGKRVARMKLIQDTVKMRLEGLPEDAEHDDLWAEAMDLFLRPPDEDPGKPAVILSTVHGSKGLQWHTVHVAGFSEGLMPFQREGKIFNMTEERCLAYVAMTRAEVDLHLHHPRIMDFKMGGDVKELSMSRFVQDIREKQPEAIQVLGVRKTPGQGSLGAGLRC